jgi:hypothetical protein
VELQLRGKEQELRLLQDIDHQKIELLKQKSHGAYKVFVLFIERLFTVGG